MLNLSLNSKLIITALLIGLILVSCTNFWEDPYSLNSKKYRNLYANQIPQSEKVIRTWYHFVVTQNRAGKYVVRKFYPETKQLTSKTEYSNKKARIKHGLEEKWYDNGFKESIGNYVKGKKEGLWRYYPYNDSNIISEGNYKNNKKNGIWKEYFHKGRISSSKNYVNGIKDGDFTMYDSLGHFINQGIYKADTIYQESNPNISDGIEHEPIFSNCVEAKNLDELIDCSSAKFLTHTLGKINYPEEARRLMIQGKANVRIIVGKDGSIDSLVVTNGICQSIENECVRVVSELPKFYQPAIMNGDSVKCWLTIPFTFRLR